MVAAINGREKPRTSAESTSRQSLPSKGKRQPSATEQPQNTGRFFGRVVCRHLAEAASRYAQANGHKSWSPGLLIPVGATGCILWLKLSQCGEVKPFRVDHCVEGAEDGLGVVRYAACADSNDVMLGCQGSLDQDRVNMGLFETLRPFLKWVQP